jgi:NAD(P)-dependent dehydrogenase (short-subunit alcohol dehydrogenase family)
MDSKIWLITGCSRGIGKVLAEAALHHGDRVVATARQVSQLADLVSQWPEQCLAVSIDMDDPASIATGAALALQHWGRVDVLVNNAGYGLQGMVEEVTMEQVRAQMETNFFGLVQLTQLILPSLRKQQSGYIINLSSMAGLRGSPGFGMYNASKFAVEGFTEALALEVAGFGIRVSVVEPGPYRTDWAGDSLKRSKSMAAEDANSPYAEVNKKFKSMLDGVSGKQPGDPRQIAAVLIDAANHPSPPLHMVFGDVAIGVWSDRRKKFDDSSFMSFYPHDQYSL